MATDLPLTFDLFLTSNIDLYISSWVWNTWSSEVTTTVSIILGKILLNRQKTDGQMYILPDRQTERQRDHKGTWNIHIPAPTTVNEIAPHTVL